MWMHMKIALPEASIEVFSILRKGFVKRGTECLNEVGWEEKFWKNRIFKKIRIIEYKKMKIKIMNTKKICGFMDFQVLGHHKGCPCQLCRFKKNSWGYWAYLQHHCKVMLSSVSMLFKSNLFLNFAYKKRAFLYWHAEFSVFLKCKRYGFCTSFWGLQEVFVTVVAKLSSCLNRLSVAW